MKVEPGQIWQDNQEALWQVLPKSGDPRGPGDIRLARIDPSTMRSYEIDIPYVANALETGMHGFRYKPDLSASNRYVQVECPECGDRFQLEDHYLCEKCQAAIV